MNYELQTTDNWQLETDNCRVSSTFVMSALQIRLFMQNKANFRKSQMNVNKVLTKDYEQKTLGQRGKSKPIKANQSQLKPILCQNKANSNPISKTKKPSMLLSIMILAAAIIFSEFGVLVLTTGQKSHILPLLYFPIVLNPLFEGIS